MKAAHTVLYMKKHTQTYASYPANGHQLYELGVDFEVEGVRYIYRDASRAGRLRTGPASFKEQRSRTRRRSHCMPRRLPVADPGVVRWVRTNHPSSS